MERRLTAILAADIVGYSKLMGADQSATLTALRHFRDNLLEPKVVEHRGNIVKRMGDGWIVEFPSITDAVDCAIVILQGLNDEQIIQLRIGIHIGEVVFENDDVFGDGVNVAARLEAMAEPNQVLISDTAHNSLDRKAASTFAGGEQHDLKNISRQVGVWFWPAQSEQSKHTAGQNPTLPDKPSIAVLPFDNMSGDPEQEYFADGVTEDIITALSKIRSLFVIARNSSFTYKGTAVDIREVSSNLGVRYVLEGSIRKSASRVRLTGQLIDAQSGNHIWAERFDSSLEDVFELQDQITAQVAAAVAPSIRTAEIARARRKRTDDLTAYDLYLQALAKVNLLESEAAYDLLSQSRSRSPEFAPAYGLEAWCRTLWIYSTDHLDFSDNSNQAVTLCRKALKLSDGDPELLGQIGYALAYFEDNIDLGRDMVRQALEIAPCLAWLWSSHGFLEIFWGNTEDALQAFATAQRLDPLDSLAFRAKCGSAICFILKGEYEKALKSAQDALGMSHGNMAALRFAATSAAMMGNSELAKRYVDELLRIEPTYSSSRWYRNMPIRHAERFDILSEGMRRAGLPE